MDADISDAIQYCPNTGRFVWKIRPSRRHAAGTIAGGLGKKGYYRVCYRGRWYEAQRLAWYLMTGEWPPHQVDHRNRDPADNRWCNLRLATPSQNGANRADYSRLLPRGVVSHKSGRFQAQITKDRRTHYLGLYDTPDDAASAFRLAAETMHGEFASVPA